MTQRSDSELIEATLRGDIQSFGCLYDRYAGLVKSICFDFTNDLHRSEDLTQEVFVRAYGRLGSLNKTERFAGWLKGITRLVCLEWCRAATRSKTESLVSDPAAAPERSGQDITEMLDEAIANVLDDTEKEVIHSYYLQDRSVDFVRKFTGLSRSGVFAALKRAKIKLKKYIDRTGSAEK